MGRAAALVERPVKTARVSNVMVCCTHAVSIQGILTDVEDEIPPVPDGPMRIRETRLAHSTCLNCWLGRRTTAARSSADRNGIAKVVLEQPEDERC